MPRSRGPRRYRGLAMQPREPGSSLSRDGEGLGVAGEGLEARLRRRAGWLTYAARRRDAPETKTEIRDSFDARRDAIGNRGMPQHSRPESDGDGSLSVSSLSTKVAAVPSSRTRMRGDALVEGAQSAASWVSSRACVRSRCAIAAQRALPARRARSMRAAEPNRR